MIDSLDLATYPNLAKSQSSLEDSKDEKVSQKDNVLILSKDYDARSKITEIRNQATDKGKGEEGESQN